MFHSLFSWAVQLLDGSVPRWGSCPGRRFGIYRVVEATLTYSGFTRLFQGMCCCRPLVLARRIGCDLRAVPAEFHTAPAPGALFAGVIKVPDTGGTFPDPITIRLSKECCSVISQWGEQVFGLARLKPQFRDQPGFVQFQPGVHGVPRHEPV